MKTTKELKRVLNESIVFPLKKEEVVFQGLCSEIKKDFFSGLISWKIKADYSHSFNILWDKNIQDWVFDHTRGVATQLDNLDCVMDGNHIINHLYMITPNKRALKAYRNWRVLQNGKKYSISQILSMSSVLRFTGITDDQETNGQKQMICSEDCVRGIGILYEDPELYFSQTGKSPDSANPKDHKKFLDKLIKPMRFVKKVYKYEEVK